MADREEVEKEARRSLKSYHIGNSDSMHSTSRATSPVDTGDQSADETSGAKVDKKIKNGKDFLKSIAAFSVEVQRGEVAGKDFVRAFMQYLGYNDHGQSSEYIHFSAYNERITLRMSDHRGNARNIIINGVRTDKGYSIVISSEEARDGIKFKNSSWAQVDEYVYKDPSQKQLVDITRGLFNLFDEGEYLDLAGAAEHNVSPRAEKDGQKKDDTLFRDDPLAAILGDSYVKASEAKAKVDTMATAATEAAKKLGLDNVVVLPGSCALNRRIKPYIVDSLYSRKSVQSQTEIVSILNTTLVNQREYEFIGGKPSDIVKFTKR